jgi:hypothetical protein
MSCQGHPELNPVLGKLYPSPLPGLFRKEFDSGERIFC